MRKRTFNPEDYYEVVSNEDVFVVLAPLYMEGYSDSELLTEIERFDNENDAHSFGNQFVLNYANEDRYPSPYDEFGNVRMFNSDWVDICESYM